MSASADVYGYWMEHDGKVVLIDGIKHRLRCSSYEAVYPYRRQVVTVDAEPVNRSSRYYRDMKRKLGDDWSTDVLASDVEVQSGILAQVQLLPQADRTSWKARQPVRREA